MATNTVISQPSDDGLSGGFVSSPAQATASSVQPSDDGLSGGFVQSNQTSPQTAPQTPDNGAVQFGKGFYESAIQPVLQTVQHPVDTVKNLLPNLVSSQKAMIANSDKVNADPKSTVGQRFDAALYEIPGIGPVLKQADDLNAQGKHAEAYGQAAGILATIFGPKVAGLAKGALAADAAEGATEGAAALAKPATVTSDNVARYFNQHIGLQPSDLTKYGKLNPEVPAEIGRTVYDEAGFKPNLADQRAAIEVAKDSRLAKTQSLLQRADAITPPIDLHRILIDSAVDLTDELKNEGESEGKIEAVNTNLNRLGQQYGRTTTPSEATAIRNNIRPTNFDPNTANVAQRYAQKVYHGINDEVANSLSPADAAAFRENNRIVHNLIVARDAAGEKLTKAGMKADGPVDYVNKVDLIHPQRILTDLIPEGRNLQAGIKATKAAEALKGAPGAVASAAKTVVKGAASAVPGISQAALASDIIHGALPERGNQ